MKGSSMKDLEPNHFVELRYNRKKQDLRYDGSFQLSLRRPSRTPAYSRPYVPGDPVQLIDWKVFARTDQLLMREEHDESAARVLIVVDLGPTMDWPDSKSKIFVIKKRELALRAALNISYLHFRVADFVKTTVAAKNVASPDQSLGIKNATDVSNLFERLKGCEFGEEGLLNHSSNFLFDGRPFDVGYWVTDGLGVRGLPRWVKYCKNFRYLHCLSSYEVDVEWVEPTVCYYDHSSERREYLGSVLKDGDQFQKRITDWLSDTEQEVIQNGGRYQLITEATGIKDFHDQLLESW